MSILGSQKCARSRGRLAEYLAGLLRTAAKTELLPSISCANKVLLTMSVVVEREIREEFFFRSFSFRTTAAKVVDEETIALLAPGRNYLLIKLAPDTSNKKAACPFHIFFGEFRGGWGLAGVSDDDF